MLYHSEQKLILPCSETMHGIDNWPEYAQIKANLRKFVMSVLNDPTHPRYRTYCYLQRASINRSGTHGETSLVRTLHAASLHQKFGRFPMVRSQNLWPIHQVFAEYYNVELMQFEDIILDEDDTICYERPLTRGRDLGITGTSPRKRQVWIFKEMGHFTPGQPIAGAPQPFFLDIRRNIHRRVSKFPWHP